MNWGKNDSRSVTEGSGLIGREELIQGDNLLEINGGKSPAPPKFPTTDTCDDWSGCLNIITVGKMRALVQKNFLRMWRNVGIKLFIFALPVMQVIPFCMAIGRDPTDLKLAIVNHEMDYTNMSYQNCHYQPGCKLSNLSCRFLDNLNNNAIRKLYYPDPKSAIDAVREGNAWGALYFTENFTDATVARMALGEDADEETIDQSEIRVWLDMSNQQIGAKLQRDLKLSYQAFARELFKSCKQNPNNAEIWISFKESIYGSTESSSTN